MNVDLAQMAVGLQMASAQHSAQIAILKKNHEMERALIDMVATATKTPPPAPSGMGSMVDKSA